MAQRNAEQREREAPKQLPVSLMRIGPAPLTAEQAAAHEADVQRRAREARAEQLRAGSRVPKRYAAADMDDAIAVPEAVRPRYERAVAMLRQLLTAPATFAMIGTRGPGKTHMACALVNAFCETGRAARYLNAMDYFIELKSTYDDKANRDEGQVERDYLRPDLLVVDEVHERGDTDWETRMLTRLVNRRYENEQATVLICNLTLAEFEKRVGDSIADRITQGGGVIACDWESIRGKLGGGSLS